MTANELYEKLANKSPQRKLCESVSEMRVSFDVIRFSVYVTGRVPDFHKAVPGVTPNLLVDIGTYCSKAAKPVLV